MAAPDPDSPRAEALAAMSKADTFELYSLQPWQPPADMGPAPAYGTPQYEIFEREQTAAWRRSQAQWYTRTACLLRNEILGRTAVGPADIAPVRDALRLSLSQVPDYVAACIAEYRHAIAFQAQGHRYECCCATPAARWAWLKTGRRCSRQIKRMKWATRRR